MVVPGSQQVKAQAEREGLDEVFRRAGFDWRGAGCSMCLGMNPDIAAPGERVASTSNRNFEGRQGRGARSHLVSPQMAAAAAIEGRFVDIRDWEGSTMKAIETITGPRIGPEPRRRRHRPDHPQAVPQAGRAHRLRRVPVLRLGEGAGLGAADEPDPRRRAELRLRLKPRARSVGARGLRLPGDHRAELRRHLPLQLHEDRAASGRAAGTACAAIAEAGEAQVDLAGPGGALAGRDARSFEIDPDIKHRLLNGLDDIALTLEQEDAIARLRARPGARRPGHDGAVTRRGRVTRLGRGHLRPRLRHPAARGRASSSSGWTLPATRSCSTPAAALAA